MNNLDERPPFMAALNSYRRAKSKTGRISNERETEKAIERLDLALDRLIAEPSPDLAAFGEKVRILDLEYGSNAQPRHLAAIYADVLISLAPAFFLAASGIQQYSG